MVEGQSRPCVRRRDRARSGRADRDAAALPAHRRPRHHAARSRQRRGSGGRLSRSASHRRSARGRPGATQTIRLAGKQRSGVSLPISATGVGIGNVAIRISGPNGFEIQRSYTLAAKPATQVLTRRTVRPIAPRGEHHALERPVRRSGAGTGGVSSRSVPRPRSTSPRCCRRSTAIRSAAPNRSPAARCRCSTSTSWRARRSCRSTPRRPAHPRRHRAAAGAPGLERLVRPVARGGDDTWLDAYVTDFLTRARERNFAVPEVAFRLALDRLRNHVGQSDPAKDGEQRARPTRSTCWRATASRRRRPALPRRHQARRAEDADRQGADRRGARHAGRPGARRTRLRAALADISPQPKLEFGRADYGSSLRDAAALVTLASEGGAPRADDPAAVERIEAARNLTPYTSTQEKAWMVLAARALARDTAHVARCGRRDEARRALPQLPASRLRDSACASPTTARTPCRRWSRSAARR